MIQKILCIGAEIEDTDHRVTALAAENNSKNHGLIDSPDFEPAEPGYYHTTVVDLNEGEIERLACCFDLIMLLDQPRHCYPHWKTWLRTYRLIKALHNRQMPVDYEHNNNVRQLEFWWHYLRTNLSFCFHPFMALIPDTDVTNICPKNKIAIKSPQEIQDWRTDADYRKLRDRMLAGKKLPLHCHDCYDKEKRGVESTRQYETLEWAARLQFDAPDDFDKLPDPLFYELRPSNKCNIMCRMCDDAHSHLIAQERKELGMPLYPWKFQNFPLDLIKFDTVERIYVAGGEPTIMPEFYDFLQRCIDIGRTDFELCIGTNGMKFSSKLLTMLEKFSDVILSFSFDGYGKVNDYIRWGSDFDTIVQNSRQLRSYGHTIGLQTVPSVYNVTRLHEIFEFYDSEFPDSLCLMQAAEGHNNVMRPWHHPRADLVIDSMTRCRKTNHYRMAGRSGNTYIDAIYSHYSRSDFEFDRDLLHGFFSLNDQLDKARNSRLGDYIPELEECRSTIV